MPRRLIFILILVLAQCDQFNPVSQDPIVARVGSNFLYQSDLRKNMPEKIYKEDSISMAQGMINAWAKKQILFDRAILNLDENTQSELNGLIENYRLDLWGSTYKEIVVKSSADTKIDSNEVKTYYLANKKNFKLREDALQLRYITLPKGNIDLDEITEHFKANQGENKVFLDSLSYQFNQFELNDSIWMTKRDFISLIPKTEHKNYKKYLKKSQFFFLEDAFEVYLLHIEDYRLRNENAPFSMVKNTIKKIVFNRNKLKFLKQFDQDILQDAIQTNKFEIYN